MNFEFGKYTEITKCAFERNAEYERAGYTRLFICPDVWNFHFIRVLPGYNGDYQKDESKILVELNEIDVDRKGQNLSMFKLNQILDEDDFSNYDYHVFTNMEDVIESIDEGFGILNLETT